MRLFEHNVYKVGVLLLSNLIVSLLTEIKSPLEVG